MVASSSCLWRSFPLNSSLMTGLSQTHSVWLWAVYVCMYNSERRGKRPTGTQLQLHSTRPFCGSSSTAGWSGEERVNTSQTGQISHPSRFRHTGDGGGEAQPHNDGKTAAVGDNLRDFCVAKFSVELSHTRVPIVRQQPSILVSMALSVPPASISFASIVNMSEFLADKVLQRNSGGTFTPATGEELKGKLVALYFSAHWCPPCRGFTPTLKKFHTEAKADGFEIVFVSFDRTEAALHEYLKESHGDWLFVPFGDALIQELSEKYDVSGIPALIVIKPNGDVITEDARDEVDEAETNKKTPKDIVEAWKKLQ